MSKEFLNNGNNLPPNVNGKLRGYLEIEITELVWSAAAFNGAWKLARGSRKLKTPDNFIGSGGVSIKFIWWGQSLQDAAVIKVPGYSGKLENKVVHYGVHTNPKLFKNYLSNCEPIEIKLTANTSNLQLGTVFARVPLEILNGCKLDGCKEVIHVGKFRIFSPKNVHLGSIELKFKMLFYDNLNSARSSVNSWKSLQSKEILGSDLILNGLKTSRSYKSFKNENLSTGVHTQNKSGQTISSLKSLSPKILDYLSGRDMSPMEEENALEEIRSTSPLNSFVDQFLTDRVKTKQEDLYSRLDSLRLTIKSLSLISAGIREVYVQSLASVSFTVECRISPNLLDNVRRKCDYDVMRFYSDTYSDKAQKINFNKDAIRAVRIVRNEFDPSIVEQAYLLFTIWWREFGSKHSRCLGTTKFDFTSLFETPELEQTKRLPVISCSGNIYVADLVCKVTLGTRGVHFGPDFMTFFKDENTCNVQSSLRDNSTSSADMPSKNISSNKRKIRKRNTDNDDVEKTSENTSNSSTGASSRSSVMTEKSHQATQTVGTIIPRKMSENGNFVEATKPLDNDQYKLLQGLLYVGALRNVKPIEGGGYFLVCRAFWKEDATSTDFAQENSFNFLEIFPIINDQKFLDRVRNNHLNLELWQKTSCSPEQMIGVVRLPLHQFFIAFRDSTITNHLCQAKLPVISIDGWVPITSPLSGEICGQLQSLLAIGTEEQLEYLKASRGLNFNYVCLNPIPDVYGVPIPVPQIPKLPNNHPESDRPASCDVEIQTNLNESNSISARRERLSDLLGTFIENLAQRLPTERHSKENSLSEENNSGVTPQNHSQGVQIRKTSDLLDVLQKALVTPPTYNMTSRRSNSDSAIISSVPQHTIVPQKVCKILLEIESALHLPRNHLKLCNKKCSKRAASGNKMKQSRLPPDEEPSAYVTFQAEEGYGQMMKSHEGLVYATNVVEKNCSPSWMKRFEVAVPADLLTNDEKRFILKVWRKATTDLAQCRLLPTPMEDSIIGFAAIDLNVLLARMPCISGWFNIVDFNGRVNGQIKVNVQPLEDVMKFKETTMKSSVIASHISSDLETVNQVADLNNTTLSRAIKRKFTELEEITQRLRARLFDVTGEVVNEEVVNLGAGTDDAQLDEFERDISTPAEEDDEDEDIDGRQNFGWLGCVPSNIDAIHSECSSASGGDSQERIQLISEYLRRTDLNEPLRQEIYSNTEEECKLPEGGTEGSRCTND